MKFQGFHRLPRSLLPQVKRALLPTIPLLQCGAESKNRASKIDPVFCGASEALRGGTGLRGLEVLVQCLHFRDEVSEVSDPTASKKQKWESNPVIRALL